MILSVLLMDKYHNPSKLTNYGLQMRLSIFIPCIAISHAEFRNAVEKVYSRIALSSGMASNFFAGFTGCCHWGMFLLACVK